MHKLLLHIGIRHVKLKSALEMTKTVWKVIGGSEEKVRQDTAHQGQAAALRGASGPHCPSVWVASTSRSRWPCICSPYREQRDTRHLEFVQCHPQHALSRPHQPHVHLQGLVIGYSLGCFSLPGSKTLGYQISYRTNMNQAELGCQAALSSHHEPRRIDERLCNLSMMQGPLST